MIYLYAPDKKIDHSPSVFFSKRPIKKGFIFGMSISRKTPNFYSGRGHVSGGAVQHIVTSQGASAWVWVWVWV